jgi:hypothetical protein
MDGVRGDEAMKVGRGIRVGVFAASSRGSIWKTETPKTTVPALVPRDDRDKMRLWPQRSNRSKHKQPNGSRGKLWVFRGCEAALKQTVLFSPPGLLPRLTAPVLFSGIVLPSRHASKQTTSDSRLRGNTPQVNPRCPLSPQVIRWISQTSSSSGCFKLCELSKKSVWQHQHAEYSPVTSSCPALTLELS